ncbi:MAG: GTP-sensing pleiotropic transcriptional regulator CodY, partial [Succiniclasticum sp.]|nr:GTP-sensing pleiotropic transcriptional regulator CodY [Succiniclasticum sp.]
MKLLEKARILNRLMQNGERVKYKEVALLLRNLISSNVYVIDIDGKIMGYGLLDEFECDVMRDMVLADQRFPEKYMEFVKETTETNSNISHKEQKCSFIDTKKCMYGEKRTTIVPVNGNGERIATLILARYDRDFNDDDLLLAEYAAAVIGVEILRE